MSEVTKVNEFFRTAVKADVDIMRNKIILTDRQVKIFDMYYLRGSNVDFIADSLYISPSTINQELRKIRQKIIKVL